MYRARLTKAGARRIGLPYLAGEIVEYDGIHHLRLCVKNVYYAGQHIRYNLSFRGPERGLILLDRPPCTFMDTLMDIEHEENVYRHDNGRSPLLFGLMQAAIRAYRPCDPDLMMPFQFFRYKALREWNRWKTE